VGHYTRIASRIVIIQNNNYMLPTPCYNAQGRVAAFFFFFFFFFWQFCVIAEGVMIKMKI
jgi:hypothetical protein